MVRNLVFVLVSMCGCAHAGSVFEREMLVALANPTALVRTDVTNRIWEACLSENQELRMSAALAKSAVEYQLYLNTADKSFVHSSLSTLSNALTNCESLSNSCSYSVCMVLSAGNSAALTRYVAAYEISTNALGRMSRNLEGNATNEYLCAVLRYYKMEKLDVVGAACYVAGMSAAVLGNVSAASNYANRVDAPYRQEIYDFIE